MIQIFVESIFFKNFESISNWLFPIYFYVLFHNSDKIKNDKKKMMSILKEIRDSVHMYHQFPIKREYILTYSMFLVKLSEQISLVCTSRKNPLQFDEKCKHKRLIKIGPIR